MTSSVSDSTRLKEQIEFNRKVVSDKTSHVNTNVNFGNFKNTFEHLNVFVNNTFENHLNKEEILCTLNGERETNLIFRET